MKFNKVAAICKSRKCIHIYNDPESGAQWLGDSNAFYLLEGMPRITPEECLRLFDVPESKHTDYFCKYTDLPQGIDFTDETGINSPELKTHTATIGWRGQSFQLFIDGSELYAINEEYITPFAGDLSYIRYHRREMKVGGFLLGINVGLCLKAVICPSFLHRAEVFTENIRAISDAFLFMQRNYPTPRGTEEQDTDQRTLEEMEGNHANH